MKQLQAEDDPARRVLKITRKQIKAALKKLEQGRLDDQSVHSARKSLKKARAGLRMLRPGIKDAEYRKANVALRDAARPLSALRDAKALEDTLTQLVNGQRKRASRTRPAGLARLLRQQHRQAHARMLHDRHTLANSRRLLRRTRARLAKWQPGKSNWKLLGPAVEHAYDKAREARAAAQQSGTAEARHEWRKQVKYLRYSLEILEPLWPAMVGSLAQQAHQLSDELGDSHDLSVLCEVTVAHPDTLESPATLDKLLSLTEHRQQALTRESNLLGSRLLGESPHAFASRLGHYWHDWRQSTGVA